MQQIIISGIGNDDLHSIPDDVPILDLGISSLALVEGMRQVYDRFGVLISIRRIIEGQVTLGTLALYIEQELTSQKALKKKSQTTQWKVERQIPLAPSQQHLGFLSRYSNEASAAFNETLLIQLNGTLHGPALHAALEEAGNRHEALRTALNPAQNTLDVGTGEALELAVSPASPEQLPARLAEIVARPFEIGKRLFRAELYRLSENQHVLALVGHALVLEQQALKIILDDIAELYWSFSRDQPASPAPLNLQWADYLALSNTDNAQEARRLAENYWQEIFDSDIPRLELPTDHPRPPIKKYSGSRLELRLDSVIHERLQAYALSEGLSVETVLFAAFTAFIHRLSASDDIVIGTQSTSLYLDESMSAIANTRNMLPVRTSYDTARTFKDHVQIEAETLAKANLHKHLSLAEIIQLLQLPRDQSRSALFSAAFRAQRDTAPTVFSGLACQTILPPASGARYDLELIALVQGHHISLVCDYSTELFTAGTISHWLNGMAALLDAGLQDANQACGLLPMMTPHEREMLLLEWNQTGKEFPREKTTLDLITEQAGVSREKTAIRFGETSLGYAQLMERVEQIAATLHQRGIKHGARVGILMERSLDVIPALLAIWRVGALYVPIDIGFPKNRIAYMLEDAEIHTLIVNRDLLNLPDDEHKSSVLCIEEIGAQVSTPVSIPPANSTDGAYIIYTSGSTGKPKGVEIRHDALLNCLLAT
ncbi:MAG: condensation domain-containing protein, partial [Anaerolineales bacterium]